MGRDALVVWLPTRNKGLSLALVFPTDKASPRHYLCGPKEKVKIALDKYK